MTTFIDDTRQCLLHERHLVKQEPTNRFPLLTLDVIVRGLIAAGTHRLQPHPANAAAKHNTVFISTQMPLVAAGYPPVWLHHRYQESRVSRRLTAVSLFSGAGGFCHGVEGAGFEIKVAVENNESACLTYRANFPRVPLFEGDIRDFLGRRIKSHRRRYALEDIDLVYGGPPCQGHSTLGQRKVGDPRNGLWIEFAGVVAELRPRAIVMENVAGILQTENGNFKEHILGRFRELGYGSAHVARVDASQFGVPQKRDRVFFVGIRDDLSSPVRLEALIQTKLSSLTAPPVTCKRALGDLPHDAVVGRGPIPYPNFGNLTQYQALMRQGSTMLTGHHTKAAGLRRMHIIQNLAPGAKGDSLPQEIWSGARPQKWRRLHPDQPSHTILANAGKDLSEWVHYGANRFISLREAARLQSFPDRFLFPGSQSASLHQIGNAVPPLLALAVGKAIHGVLETVDGKQNARLGRPPKGARSLTAGERTAAWRAAHKVASLEVPGDLADRLRNCREDLGVTTAQLLALALDALEALSSKSSIPRS